MSTDIIKPKYSGIECDNCGEELHSFDPLEPHVWCSMCKMKAAQISATAQRELKSFGEMRRKVREKKQHDEQAQKEMNASVTRR